MTRELHEICANTVPVLQPTICAFARASKRNPDSSPRPDKRVLGRSEPCPGALRYARYQSR